MKQNSRCQIHGKKLNSYCLSCDNLICYRCLSEHGKKGCTYPIDLPTYAAEKLLPKYKEQLASFELKKKEIEPALKEFIESAEGIKNELERLKDNLKQLLDTIEVTIEILTRGIDQSIPLQDTIRTFLTDQYKDLEDAIKKEEMGYIIRKIKSKEPSIMMGIGDGEKKLVEAAKESISYLFKTGITDNINNFLKSIVEIYKQFAYQSASKVVVNYVYGTCSTQANYTRLCIFDIQSKKITPVIPVVQWCTVTQLGKQVFLSGGCNSVVTNAVSEFIEEDQNMILKEPMKFPKYCHRTEAISPLCFITIGGDNGTMSIPYCEEYSVTDNKWQMLPNLNRARHYAGTSILGKYVYAIGGKTTNGEVERLDLTEKKRWEIVNVVSDITFTSDTIAFPSLLEEITLFRGGIATEVAVYNVKERTIKKQSYTLKGDYYRYNSVCQIRRNIYIIGHFGHIHIYKVAEKKYEELDYKTLIIDS